MSRRRTVPPAQVPSKLPLAEHIVDLVKKRRDPRYREWRAQHTGDADAYARDVRAELSTLLASPSSRVTEDQVERLLSTVMSAPPVPVLSIQGPWSEAERIAIPFLFGFADVPQRAGIASTARAIQRLAAIVVDVAVPYLYRVRIAERVRAASGLIQLEPPLYAARHLALASARYCCVHATLDALLRKRGARHAPRLDEVAAFLEERAAAEENGKPLPDVAKLKERRSKGGGANINAMTLIESTIRAVWDDALPDHTFSELAALWARERSRDDGGGDRIAGLAHTLVARAFSSSGRKCDAANVRRAESDAGGPQRAVDDPYGRHLASNLEMHPAFFRWTWRTTPRLECEWRWLAYPHALWPAASNRRRRKPPS